MRTNKYSFIVIALVSIAIIFAIGIVIIYFATFSDTTISHDTNQWSHFGSVLSGSFSLLGSVATLATLWHLILQNKENSELQHESIKLQKDSFKLQEKLSEEQRIISETQLSVANFEKYEKHKNAFNKFIDEVEILLQGKLKFFRREYLYQNIFPENNYKYCSYEPSENNEFIKELKNISSVIYTLHEKPAREITREDMFALSNFAALLGLYCNEETTNGNISLPETKSFFNLYETYYYIKCYSMIIKEIFHFLQNDVTTVTKVEHDNCTFITREILRYFTKNDEFLLKIENLGNTINIIRIFNTVKTSDKEELEMADELSDRVDLEINRLAIKISKGKNLVLEDKKLIESIKNYLSKVDKHYSSYKDKLFKTWM